MRPTDRVCLAILCASVTFAAQGCSKAERPAVVSVFEPSVDARVPPVWPDVVVAPTDVGVAATDAGVAPTDAGVAATDVGVAPADGPPASFGAGFTDLTAPLDGAPSIFLLAPPRSAAKDPESTVGLIADLDGDGAPEVIFGATLGSVSGRTAASLRYDRARGLTPQGLLGTAAGNDDLAVMAVLDLDGDGAQDLLLARIEGEVAWGLGGGRFEAPASITPREGRFGPNFTALLLDDFDDDGWLDVAYGVPGCCPACRDARILLRTGARTFVDRTDLLAAAPAGASGALLTTTLSDTRTLVSIGDPCTDDDSPTFFRWAPRNAEGLSHLEVFDPTSPDAYIRASDPGVGSRGRGLSHWVPMGAAVGDADGDGRIDLAISLNFFVGLFQDTGRLPLVDHSEQFGERPAVARVSGQRMIPWGIALVDVDQDGRLDLITAHGNDHAAAGLPSYFIGPQHPTLHWNAGGMTFTNVTTRLGLDHEGQWRTLAVGDLDRDGDADLAVGSQGGNPRILRNDIDRGYHGFSLRLRGTTSNALGVGARVAVQVAAGQPEQVHVVGSIGSPLVFSEPMVFAGLGAATRAARVRITWPSGYVQELRDVAAGTMHTVDEPALLAVTPPGRHLAADGRATATVRITPRTPDGALRPDARVEVAVAHGGGTITPARWTGDGWEATVTAPAARGSSVVEVRVDGVAVRVRPRLWWD